MLFAVIWTWQPQPQQADTATPGENDFNFLTISQLTREHLSNFKQKYRSLRVTMLWADGIPTGRIILLATVLLLVILDAVNGESNDCSCDSKLALRTKAGVKAATAGLAGALGTSALGSSMVGFTMMGIAKGSIAAFIQAKLGVFGVFSLLQSLGATGGFMLGGPIGLAVAGAVGAATYLYTSSGSETSGGCSCDSATGGEASTEDDLRELFALKAIESCVEPGTSRYHVCSGRGFCQFNKEDEELFCECKSGFFGVYCEMSSSKEVKESKQTIGSRCQDNFLWDCTQCLIQKFTLDDGNKPKNCYEKCNWDNREANEKTKEDELLRPDVGSLEMKRVIKTGVYQGTECSVPVNSTCSTWIRYNYEHSDDHLDQLVVYYSSNEAFCDS